jgi:hypothetical protein
VIHNPSMQRLNIVLLILIWTAVASAAPLRMMLGEHPSCRDPETGNWMNHGGSFICKNGAGLRICNKGTWQGSCSGPLPAPARTLTPSTTYPIGPLSTARTDLGHADSVVATGKALALLRAPARTLKLATGYPMGPLQPTARKWEHADATGAAGKARARLSAPARTGTPNWQLDSPWGEDQLQGPI